MSIKSGLNVSDEHMGKQWLAEAQADEAIRQRNDVRAIESLDGYQAKPFHDLCRDGDVFTYTDDTARRNGWPVGGMVRFRPARFEVVS